MVKKTTPKKIKPKKVVKVKKPAVKPKVVGKQKTNFTVKSVSPMPNTGTTLKTTAPEVVGKPTTDSGIIVGNKEDEERSDPTPKQEIGKSGVGNSASASLIDAMMIAGKTSTIVSALASKLSSKPTNSIQPPHVEVRALAGTGKTTTLICGMMRAKGMIPPIKPSPQQEEVWKQLEVGKRDTVRLCAFNTTITTEMKDRLIVNGLDKMGCEAKGIHSMGYGAVINAFGKLEPHNFAVRDKIEAELEGDWREMKLTKGMPELLTAVEELVSKCKQTLNEPTEENLDKLADHYDIERGDDWARVCELVPKILDRCKNPVGRISFDDQVYLPVVLNLPIFKTDIGMVDEEQDLNRMQQELVYRSAYRIIGVGDEHQAIYGFAGADTESMNRVAKHLSNTDRGMVSLPLTVTRRCGKAIVQEAKRYVPEFEAHESNPLGIVREASYTHRGKGADRIEVEWDKTYCKDVGLNDLVICRINAPLVSQCFKFLRRNIPANILGRKIGDGLISLVEKSGVDRTDKLVGWLDDWLNKELALENAKKYPSDARLIAVQDKHDCLLCFAEDCNYSHEVINKIKEMFTDKAGKCIRLSSIHKAKGLESQKVFFLKPDGTQFTKRNQQPWERQQADNLEYVGITRAIEELVYVY